MSDYYVDATRGTQDGDGTLAHPFKTITSALSAIDGLGNVHIHVAKGRYDVGTEVGSGETFPIVLRGVSLEGEGPEQTTIVGTGLYDGHSAARDYQGDLRATVVMGDDTAVTSLSGFTLFGGGDASPSGQPSYGVFCDRGNNADTTPNTLLTDLTVVAKYDTGVVVTNSATVSSGCNLRLSASTIREDHTGVRAVGCDDVPLAKNGAEINVAVELGDRTIAGGNYFTKLAATDHTAVGVRVSACVRTFSAWFNEFVDSDSGIVVRQPSEWPHDDQSLRVRLQQIPIAHPARSRGGRGVCRNLGLQLQRTGRRFQLERSDEPDRVGCIALESLDEPELPGSCGRVATAFQATNGRSSFAEIPISSSGKGE